MINSVFRLFGNSSRQWNRFLLTGGGPLAIGLLPNAGFLASIITDGIGILMDGLDSYCAENTSCVTCFCSDASFAATGRS